ncbi:c-type heme family protein [Rosistilla oblonga]|uniref:c-type heme family protein n=1 Tax=Rosistilla oblonga TaxID=2527990 RepID=UPI003A980A27
MNLRCRKPIAAGLFGMVMMLAVGCSSNNNAATEGNGDEQVAAAIVAGQIPNDAAKEKMLAAKEALFTTLSGRLMEAINRQGPAAAIAVCQKEAPKIAKRVGEEQGLRIGRTGVRLRNTNNVAPSWAEDLVRDKIDTPTFVVLDNGHSAALLPIKLQGKCLMCHGPQDQIAPAIQEQLTKLYPHDRATGFNEGDLRGWFWIDLPNS